MKPSPNHPLFEASRAPDAALQASRALWPSPYECPETPSRDELERWSGEEPEGWRSDYPFLDDHLAFSPVAQLALKALPWTRLPDLTDEEAVEAAETLLKQWKEAPHGASQFLATPKTGRQAVPQPQIGMIMEIKDRARVFVNGRWSERYLWQTPQVLLTAAPKVEYRQKIWRAVVVTEAELWPEAWREADDVPLRTQDGQGWVAHLWLEYPVHEEQLGTPLVPLEVESLETLAAYGATLPDGQPPEDARLEARRSPQADLERRRMMHTCRFLKLTTEAERAWAAHLQTVIQQSAVPEPVEIEKAHLAHHLALAADTEKQVPVIFTPKPVKEALGLLRGLHEKDAGTGCGAEQTSAPTPLPSGMCHAVWKLLNTPPSLRRNHVFYALHRVTCRVLGGGFVRDNQGAWEAVLCGSLWELFDAIKPEEMMLVVTDFAAA